MPASAAWETPLPVRGHTQLLPTASLEVNLYANVSAKAFVSWFRIHILVFTPKRFRASLKP